MSEFCLEIFPGDFGLPTLDLECLITLTYCRFSGIPVTVKQVTNCYFSTLPTLRTKKETIYGSKDIIDYFERCNYGVDEDLSGDEASNGQKLDLWSYKTLVKKRLDPCLQFFWWYDDENYNEFLRGWYATQLPLPLNFFVPYYMRKDNIKKLESNFTSKIMENDSRKKLIESSVVFEARYCLNLMAEKLGEKSYFFGEKPTSFDALIFAYLALLYKVPVKNKTIKFHIVGTKTLEHYIERVLKTYFPFKQPQSSKSPFEPESTEQSFATIKWKDVVFSGAFAAILMIFYAFYNGILHVEDMETYEDEDDDAIAEQEEILEDEE